MQNLFNFIVKNVHWLLFLLLLFLSVFLLIDHSEFQRSKYLSVADDVTGSIYTVTNGFQSYMNLKSANEDLTKKIAELETSVFEYQQALASRNDTNQTASVAIDTLHTLIYQFIPAQVVDKNVSRLENYITLNKGANDGITPDMGVLSTNGIVGVVMKTSSHFSIVIPVLNPKFRLNCKLKTNYSGPLVWDGKDAQYTYLTEIPRHAIFQIGDTVVTSGYSTIFPKGLPVGTIVSVQKEKNDNYNSLKIKLFTNFHTLNTVTIVKNEYQREQNELQKTIQP
ncbi:cell shape-determining protein MreC [Bacteroidia bacterium]|nr:cell shape-determining protein MreC [Bacteroidia bacterium]